MVSGTRMRSTCNTGRRREESGLYRGHAPRFGGEFGVRFAVIAIFKQLDGIIAPSPRTSPISVCFSAIARIRLSVSAPDRWLFAADFPAQHF